MGGVKTTRPVASVRLTVKTNKCERFRGTAIAGVQSVNIPIFEEKERVMTTDPEILTVKEISELLRVHPTTVYKLLRGGRIPSFRVGSDWRFRKDQIERWITEVSVGAPQ
jgi:excisionase family DNA binding protein